MTNNDNWRQAWAGDDGALFAQVYGKRASGELPLMESAKACAKLLEKIVQPNDVIADIGCAAGQYLPAINQKITAPFSYIGVDATPLFIETAREIFKSQPHAQFKVGDINNIPLKDKEVDVAINNNVLLHLPYIEKAIPELCRITKKYLMIRTIVGERSFVIKEVFTGDREIFDESGEPVHFNYFNVYSKSYLERLLVKSGAKKVTFSKDDDFDPEAINRAASEWGADMATTSNRNEQFNDVIHLNWHFILVEV